MAIGQNRPQHRQGQIDEDPPDAGAVDPRRLERLLRQGLQPCQQDQEHQRRPFPDIERDEAEEGLHRLAENLHLTAAHGLGKGRQHADVACIDQAKDDARPPRA